MTKFNKVIISLLITFCLVLFIIFYFFFLKKHNFQIPCPIHSLFNIYCPGCGTTRMIESLLTLNIYQAFRYNPLIFISLPFILLLSLDKYINWLKGSKSCLLYKITNKVWYVLLVVCLIYFIIRNLPGFEYLTPTII